MVSELIIISYTLLKKRVGGVGGWGAHPYLDIDVSKLMSVRWGVN